ncbi:MAG: NAD(P)-dependent oxidoreductase, partial [Bacteroidota bacterium]
HDTKLDEQNVSINFFDGQQISFSLISEPLDTLLGVADFISIHVPAQKNYIIGAAEFDKMKQGVAIVNAARGGTLDEVALVDAIKSGKVSFAGLDVFESEPQPEISILMHPNISLSPHIGAATLEAQDRIGVELASQLKELLG